MSLTYRRTRDNFDWDQVSKGYADLFNDLIVQAPK